MKQVTIISDYYISKGEWFKEGIVALCLDDYRPDINSGLFRGFKDGRQDEEVCTFDEFERYDKEL